MQRICFFASYVKGEKLPYYLRYYLRELKKHFAEIVFVSGNNSLDAESRQFLKDHQIRLQLETNEGFDFGLWYKVMQQNDMAAYDQLALINDSCILFRPLDDFFAWTKTIPADVYGMSESMAVSRHLQSYFLVFGKQTFSALRGYFSQQGIKGTIQEVISDYEIGLSAFLLNEGYRLAAFADNKNYAGEFSPYYYLLEDHLAQGVPLIKKKVIFSDYRQNELNTLARMGFTINAGHWIGRIRSLHHAETIIDFEKVKADALTGISTGDRFAYGLKRMAYQLARPLYKLLKKR